ncbi:GNAT family N-acetyltransferase [Stackebrandtia nassauensis]|uniref:GCN5-related N-acetyltransferase n=1 Tax=Stackebrandtia nassauensis (strain DSM 44728 / CIP 108903 / NRRL B-16338 / NBRC 102104 / LLR-40K-21) TaxID=446470 RepID=D3Q2Q2_STANL|nr:GNAT family N-acetyltransferase [Stackebrandtia nassauensis]ADD45803.1 GCN5-related N-acetyltransferase [Stackebrandtia nassauensis DSM 44728]
MAEIQLRDTVADDLETLFEYEQDPEAGQLANFRPRPHDRFMTHWNTKILGNDEVVSRTVLVDGEIAGNIGCWDVDGERFIGYWFGRKFWGRGIGTQAVRAFVDEVPWRPLFADPSVHNVGSVRLLEKCGFKPDGSTMESSVFGDGEVEHVMLKLD